MSKWHSRTYPRKTVPLVRGATDDETGRKYAQMLTSSEFAACRIVSAVQPTNLAEEIDVPGLLATLRDHAEMVNEGDLSRAEAMLINQADALQAIFVSLTERALRQDYHVYVEDFMRLALKAQNQCRATLETLVTIKSPPVVYARQANVTTGPQQINNGVEPLSVKANENAPNQLSEAVGSNELFQDAGAPCDAIRDDPTLEAMGEVNRTKDGGR